MGAVVPHGQIQGCQLLSGVNPREACHARRVTGYRGIGHLEIVPHDNTLLEGRIHHVRQVRQV